MSVELMGLPKRISSRLPHTCCTTLDATDCAPTMKSTTFCIVFHTAGQNEWQLFNRAGVENRH